MRISCYAYVICSLFGNTYLVSFLSRLIYNLDYLVHNKLDILNNNFLSVHAKIHFSFLKVSHMVTLENNINYLAEKENLCSFILVPRKTFSEVTFVFDGMEV